ncbi:DUF1127 domain-containing protein [Sinorhizobium sp. 8-89]|uniref:DUF1127 domain-containing protein n=1 Tax=Sinorhizobium sp. 7-81 TaxID=3049087 RepID=UPI0024C2A3ED|nr:DUF1127 domain-containing protein [Sinorhizobium sp. 7-81]MDK1386632.1 DUF1127 domain-containing protein [Sinorhizobium sp. 7-81]
MSAIDTIESLHDRGVDVISSGDERTFSIAAPAGEGVFAKLWYLYCSLAAKRRSRVALEELSAYQLKDIGVSEEEARREGAMPFWR